MPRRRELNTALTPSGCLEVVSHKQGRDGYVRVRTDGVRLPAHRVVWEKYFGPIPNGISVCHTCDNRKCINPKHLFLGTTLDNIRDMYEKGRNYKGPRYTKLTHVEVEMIRQSSLSCKQLAEKFHVCIPTVWRVKTFRSYVEA